VNRLARQRRIYSHTIAHGQSHHEVLGVRPFVPACRGLSGGDRLGRNRIVCWRSMTQPCPPLHRHMYLELLRGSRRSISCWDHELPALSWIADRGSWK
jgi:hypothetical protein